MWRYTGNNIIYKHICTCDVIHMYVYDHTCDEKFFWGIRTKYCKWHLSLDPESFSSYYRNIYSFSVVPAYSLWPFLCVQIFQGALFFPSFREETKNCNRGFGNVCRLCRPKKKKRNLTKISPKETHTKEKQKNMRTFPNIQGRPTWQSCPSWPSCPSWHSSWSPPPLRTSFILLFAVALRVPYVLRNCCI